MASREVESIIAFVKASGVPYKVTDINTPGVHAVHSFHYAQGTGDVGLAVDFAGPTPNDQQAMQKIFEVLSGQAPMLAELIHQGPGITKAVKNGKWSNGMSLYGPTTWAAHLNHVHVAVHLGTFLVVPQIRAATVEPPTKKVLPLFEPPIQTEPIVADLACPTGGAWCLAASGAVYGWGGAPHLGAPNGKDYFAGRKAARLEPVDGKYRVVAESGETYGPGF